MFEAFCGMADAPGRRILEFARKYGVLKICKHGLPSSHNPGCNLNWYDRPWEPLATWRAFSREAIALTRVADLVLEKKVGRPKDWLIVYGRSGREAPWWEQHVDVERIIIARVVNEWLTIGGVGPAVVWHHSDERPSIRFGGPSLFGALALQLALAVGQSRGLAICTHCGTKYPPAKRRPKTGQRHFCPECREKGVPNRYSLADYRNKIRNTKAAKKGPASASTDPRRR
jgi:hypothetical protein